jgi:hypothetical protein
MISKNIFKTIKPFMVKYQPEILMGMGIAGMIFSTVSAVKATQKAERMLLNRELLDPQTKLTKMDTVKLTWKYYIPTAISMAISVPCIVAGNRISNTRSMALAAAYTISETALQEYQDKTKEIVGDKKYEAIQESISSDKIQKTYPDGIQNITMIGDGDSLFFEPLSGRYFKTNWNRISKAANDLNANALVSMSGEITIGDWFSILGLGPTELDSTLGWTILDGKQGIIDISIDSVLTPDNQPCGSIRYNTMPKKI